MKPDPVDSTQLRWILSRAAAFRAEQSRLRGLWGWWPWFTCTELASNFAKSLHGRPLTRHQVRRLIQKHDPELWKQRISGTRD